MSSAQDFRRGSINILDMKEIDCKDFAVGKTQAACGKASFNYIIKGIDLCLDKQIGGIITNPISKEALHLAGINSPATPKSSPTRPAPQISPWCSRLTMSMSRMSPRT